MANYDDFRSMGTTYEFSKGPKSLYYAKGDEDLFAVVLNVPQQDDDDEWGGTDRIALERISDEIGSLQEYVTDPAGGSNGLVQKVAALQTVVNTTTPSVTVGDISLNVSTGTIAIGTGATLDANSLQLGGSGAFLVDEFSANRYDVTYKRDGIRFFDDRVTPPTVTVVVGASSYIFGASSFVVPGITINGDITVSGDVNATNLILSGNIVGVKDIGTTSAYMENLYVDVIKSSTLCGSIVNTGSVTPLSVSPGTYTIGAPANRYRAIAAEDLNLSSAWDTIAPTFSVDGTTGSLVSSGNITIDGNILATQISATTGLFTSFVAGTATICGAYLVPGTASTDLGQPSTGSMWANIYGVDGRFAGDLSVAGDIKSVAFTSYTSTITGWIVATTPIYYKKIGKTVIVNFSISTLGDAGSTAAKFTLPVAAAVTAPDYWVAIRAVSDAHPAVVGMARLSPALNPSLVECVLSPATNPAVGDFSGAGIRSVVGTLIYEAA